MNLIIDGIEVTFRSSLELKQTYSPVNNGTLLRMADGTAIKQTPAWGKLRTEITSSGWLPDGLSDVDFNDSVIVDCVANRSITSDSNAIAIPGTPRPDLDPWGVALVNDKWVDVGSSFAGGTLTIDVTAGATKYQARWMPRLTLFCNGIETETDNSEAVYSWTLSGEEV
ncbi:MAG: hypothetical protein GY694_06000 [Gammaproteobacteria bacterium]|nr:hypothetical protein [Gammaproteobacteria bacterium]